MVKKLYIKEDNSQEFYKYKADFSEFSMDMDEDILTYSDTDLEVQGHYTENKNYIQCDLILQEADSGEELTKVIITGSYKNTYNKWTATIDIKYADLDVYDEKSVTELYDLYDFVLGYFKEVADRYRY